MKKFTALILAALTLFTACIVSCGTDGKTPAGETTHDDPEGPFTVGDNCSIVIGEYAEEYVVDLMIKLRRLIKEQTGIEPAIIRDDTDRSGSEIIIGSTKRDAYAAVSGTYAANGYRVCSDENGDIVIAADSEYPLVTAFNAFCAEYLGYDASSDAITGEGKAVPKTLDLSGECPYYVSPMLDAPDKLPPERDTSEAVRTIYVDAAAGMKSLVGDGSASSPCATLEQAKGLVRELLASGTLAPGRIDVLFRPGTYQMYNTVAFTAEDSGTEANPVRYAADGDGEVIFTGGASFAGSEFAPLDGSELATHRFNSDAAKKIVKFDLKQISASLGMDLGDTSSFSDYTSNNIGILNTVYPPSFMDGSYVSLYVSGERRYPARYPDDGYLPTDGVVKNGDYYDVPVSDELAERMSGWENIDNVKIFGYLMYFWSFSYSDVYAYSNQKISIKPMHYQVVDGQEYYFFNVPEELDTPGEYYIDSDAILYYYPEDGFETSTVRFPMLSEGIIDIAGCTDITFEGITFENTRSYALRAEGDRLTVDGCRFRCIGSSAVGIYGDNSVVRDCEFYSIGKSAVTMSGGDRENLTPSGDFVYNNVIHDWGEIKRSSAHAVALGGVGVVASHNTIYSSSHQAMSYEGNDHIIERNEIYNVCMYSNDCGTIYSGRSFDYYGTLIRNNYIHDCGRKDSYVVGIYLDDCLAGQTVSGNVIENMTMIGIQVGGGRDDYICDNLIIGDINQPVSFDDRALTWSYETATTYMKDNLSVYPYQSGIWAEKYPSLAKIHFDVSDTQWDDPYFAPNPAFTLISNNYFRYHESYDFKPDNYHDVMRRFSYLGAHDTATVPDDATIDDILATVPARFADTVAQAGCIG